MGNESPTDTVIRQYELAVEMADKLSARRATANSFFLAIHAGLGAFVSAADTDVLAPISGAVLSVAWYLLLRSYRDLSTAKWEVIQALEDDLPARPFTDEWENLKSDPIPWWKPRYAELGTVERTVPVILLGLYITAGVWA